MKTFNGTCGTCIFFAPIDNGKDGMCDLRWDNIRGGRFCVFSAKDAKDTCEVPTQCRDALGRRKSMAECSEEMRNRITRLAVAIRQLEASPGNGYGIEAIEAVEDLQSAIANLEAQLAELDRRAARYGWTEWEEEK